MAPNSNYDNLVRGILARGGGNDDPDGTIYEDGSVKGGRGAGDSPDDFGGSNSAAPIEW